MSSCAAGQETTEALTRLRLLNSSCWVDHQHSILTDTTRNVVCGAHHFATVVQRTWFRPELVVQKQPLETVLPLMSRAV